MGLKQEIVLDNISSEEVRCLAALRLAILILAAVPSGFDSSTKN